MTETLNPQVREVVRTFAPGFGMEVVEVPHTGGVTDPAAVAEAATDAACVIFAQPNFFGCLEPAADLAAAANDAGAVSVAHVDLMTLGLLEAPGEYGCQLAIGEGQSAGNPLSYGGPHYGFVASKIDHVRRLPGRIVGQTVDSVGRRGFVLTLQTREQHIRREKATSNITTNQTLLATVRPRVPVVARAPRAARRRAGVPVAVGVREGHDRPRAGVRPPDGQGVRGAHHAGRRPRWWPQPESSGSIPATRSVPSIPAWTTCCWWRSPSSALAADIDRLAQVLSEVGA